ncbi:MAG: signal peptidase I [Nitrospirota bacterium]
MNVKVKKVLLWFLDLGINIAIIFGLVLIIQKWFIAPFDVSGASMCNTLNYIDGECENSYGEKIIINEATYLFTSPQRGEIVVFKADEGEDKYYIKRIIGLPGETVEVKNGNVYITEVGKTESYTLLEEYLSPENKGNTKSYFKNFSVFNVPAEHYFVLGDNRQLSTDSRSCFNSYIAESCKNSPEKAYVSVDLIRGKAWIVWWPFSKIRLIDNPDYQATSESLDEK